MIPRTVPAPLFLVVIGLFGWSGVCVAQSSYPVKLSRGLLKLGEVRFAKAGHGQKEENAKRGVGHIDVAYDHYNFSKGVEEWIAKHNVYSSEEARLSTEMKSVSLKQCFSADSMTRKRALKSWFVRMPCRPWIKFFYLYVIRLGFLDGRAGFTYCCLQRMYESMIAIKMLEQSRAASEPQDGGM